MYVERWLKRNITAKRDLSCIFRLIVDCSSPRLNPWGFGVHSEADFELADHEALITDHSYCKQYGCRNAVVILCT